MPLVIYSLSTKLKMYGSRVSNNEVPDSFECRQELTNDVGMVFSENVKFPKAIGAIE